MFVLWVHSSRLVMIPSHFNYNLYVTTLVTIVYSSITLEHMVCPIHVYIIIYKNDSRQPILYIKKKWLNIWFVSGCKHVPITRGFDTE